MLNKNYAENAGEGALPVPRPHPQICYRILSINEKRISIQSAQHKNNKYDVITHHHHHHHHHGEDGSMP